MIKPNKIWLNKLNEFVCITMLAISISSCEEALEIQSSGALATCSMACPEVSRVIPMIAFPGEIVVAEGENLKRLKKLLIDDIEVEFDFESDGEVSFLMPPGDPGKSEMTLVTEAEAISSGEILRASSKYPIITSSAELICKEMKFYDEKGRLKKGLRDCSSTIDWLKPEDIKEGVTIAGITGTVGLCNENTKNSCIAQGDFRATITEGLESKLLEGYRVGDIEGTVILPKPDDVLVGVPYGSPDTPLVGSLVLPQPNEVLIDQGQYGPGNSWLASALECSEFRRSECVAKNNYYASRPCTEQQESNCHIIKNSKIDASIQKIAVDISKFDATQALSTFKITANNLDLIGEVAKYETLDIEEGSFAGPGLYLTAEISENLTESLRSNSNILGNQGKIPDCSEEEGKSCYLDSSNAGGNLYFFETCKDGQSNCSIASSDSFVAAKSSAVVATNILTGSTIGKVPGIMETQLSTCQEYGENIANNDPRTGCYIPEEGSSLYAAKICQDDPESIVSGCIINKFDLQTNQTMKATYLANIETLAKPYEAGGRLLSSITLAGIQGQISDYSSLSLDLRETFSGVGYYDEFLGIDQIRGAMLITKTLNNLSGEIAHCDNVQQGCYVSEDSEQYAKPACVSGEFDCMVLASAPDNKKYKAAEEGLIISTNVLDGHQIGNVIGTLVYEGNTSPCEANKLTNCLTSSEFPAMDQSGGTPINDFDGTPGMLSSEDEFHFWNEDGELIAKWGDPDLSSQNVRTGREVLGIVGQYPSANYRLKGSQDIGQIEGNLNLALASDATFEYFDSLGNRYESKGDANLSQDNLRYGKILDFDNNPDTAIIGMHNIPAPQDLRASSYDDTDPQKDSIHLSWKALKNISRYQIKVSINHTETNTINLDLDNLSATTRVVKNDENEIIQVVHTYDVNNLNYESHYQFKVSAISKSGSVSNQQAIVSLRPIECNIPSGSWLAITEDEDYHNGHFCVMKFEARKDTEEIQGQMVNIPSSRPNDLPWTNISLDDAVAACNELNNLHDLDGVFSLLTNPEWMAIAKQALFEASNWDDEYVGGGSLRIGHIQPSGVSNIGLIQASSNDSEPCINTNYNCALDKKHQRTYKLHNGTSIWDLSGNAYEMVQIDTVPPNYSGLASTFINDGTSKFYRKDLIPISVEDQLWAADLGRVVYSSGSVTLRGGSFESVATQGLFTAYLKYYDGGADKVGFRCVYRPQR